MYLSLEEARNSGTELLACSPASYLSARIGEYWCTPPVIVLSFNRPHYLQPVLESLRKQHPEIDENRVHLFQDGAVNAYSGIRKAEDREIADCVALFLDLFPHGHLHVSERNIGICENFLRAERYAFLTLRARVAYFFEDDLVLSENYISTLDVLRRSFSTEPRIPYFNACGSYRSSVEDQQKNSGKVMQMSHTWGFALKRSHWNDMQPLLAPYYKMVCGQDYRRRPHDAIRAFYRKWRVSMKATSQDAAKVLATHVLGRWRASTYVCLARYIGVQGTHSTPAFYAEKGFADTTVFDQSLPRRFVVRKAEIDAAISGNDDRYRRVCKRQSRRFLMRLWLSGNGLRGRGQRS